MGLHSYNLLQGKNLQLSSVKKYNQTVGFPASNYDITLEAMALALQTFQTKVFELDYGNLVLSCSIASPLGETKRSDTGEIMRNSAGKSFFLIDTMPEWPLENPFENSKRCYVLNISELQDNDWIRLYLELAVATSNRRSTTNHDLSNLKILKLAIDTTPQDVDVEFNRKNVAIVYIRYQDSCEARVGKDVDRVAVVRRAFSEQTGCFSLVGQTLSSEIIPKKCKKRSPQLSLSLRLKPRLLSSPRRLKAYKYSGVGLSRRLH